MLNWMQLTCKPVEILEWKRDYSLLATTVCVRNEIFIFAHAHKHTIHYSSPLFLIYISPPHSPSFYGAQSNHFSIFRTQMPLQRCPMVASDKAREAKIAVRWYSAMSCVWRKEKRTQTPFSLPFIFPDSASCRCTKHKIIAAKNIQKENHNNKRRSRFNACGRMCQCSHRSCIAFACRCRTNTNAQTNIFRTGHCAISPLFPFVFRLWVHNWIVSRWE